MADIFRKDVLVNGKPARPEFIDLEGQTFAIERGLITQIRLEDEWYEDIEDPQAVVAALAAATDLSADIFSFWQRVPELTPRYAYQRESEALAVLPITSYDHWWNKQLKSRVRNLIRKSEKKGLVVRETPFDDDFIRGMTALFNESPQRQGRPFWHYGKDFDTVKAQFSRYIHREQMIGAYYEGEMIGFVMLGDAGQFGITGQVLSSVAHRDKATNNALIAKAVQLCAEKNLDHLVYFFWSDDSLAEFKRRCGFQKLEVPRYYIPLSAKGRFALRHGLHRGWKALLPKGVKDTLKRARKRWYA